LKRLDATAGLDLDPVNEGSKELLTTPALPARRPVGSRRPRLPGAARLPQRPLPFPDATTSLVADGGGEVAGTKGPQCSCLWRRRAPMARGPPGLCAWEVAQPVDRTAAISYQAPT